ncbi:hypothetical protein BKP37_05715 [Anaerobacillus alkalilacustris]|uniref:Major facilitator superfamily (MFS) profile domain-containing protein n=1 Tax=Anaerobacillus alkalilacustris TaxID=393763 RepID=A0A1S2LWL5_9BACI|nr:MFS transporter [Anaerobacillus alkalilacustris]OIJ16726.1 hypothetical protein BKP37_05715 [Anaerobacillus alkalilacustris]
MQKKATVYIMSIIGLLPLVMVLGNSMLLPILPLIEDELNITHIEVGLLLSIFSLIAAIVIPIVGFLSDRFGRKKLVLLSLFFVMVGNFVTIIGGLGVKEPYTWIFIGRIIQGIGAGGTAPLAMALIGDLFEGEQRSKSLGIIEVFNGIGKVVSPFLGALAALFSWYSAFCFYFFVSLIAFVGIYFSIKSINQEKVNEPLFHYLKMLMNVIRREARTLFPLSLIGAVGLFLLFGMLVFLSFEIERIYAINGLFKGFVFMVPLGLLTYVSYWTGKNIASNLLYMKKLLLLGITLLTGSLLGLIFFHQFHQLIFSLTIAASGVGFILPCANTLITSTVGGKERGFIVSIYGMVRFLGVAFGPIFFSLWMQEVVSMFVKASLLMIITGIWVIIAFKLTRVIKIMKVQLTIRKKIELLFYKK